MQLAEDTKIENNIIHYDVIDAMFRQVQTDTTKPYKTVKVEQTTTLKAAHYDMGQIGHAYYDTDYGNYYISTGKQRTPWNHGYAYRNDGVDIFVDSDNHPYVGRSNPGEWLTYSFTVENSGTYSISVQHQNKSAGLVQLVANQRNSANITLKESEDWNISDAVNLQFNKGENSLKLLFLNGEVNVKSIILKSIK